MDDEKRKESADCEQPHEAIGCEPDDGLCKQRDRQRTHTGARDDAREREMVKVAVGSEEVVRRLTEEGKGGNEGD